MSGDLFRMIVTREPENDESTPKGVGCCFVLRRVLFCVDKDGHNRMCDVKSGLGISIPNADAVGNLSDSIC